MASALKASTSVLALPTEDFAVPEIGICKPEHWPLSPDQILGITCRSAMNQPQLTFVSFLWKFGKCQSTSADASKQMSAGAWVGDLDPGPAEFGITSVWKAPVNLLSPSLTGNTTDQTWRLCAGTPITFTQYRPVKRVREDVTISSFRLPELAIGDRIILRGED